MSHLSLPASRDRALEFIRNNQLNTRGSMIVRQKRNAETRDLGLKTRGVATGVDVDSL